VRPSVLTSAPRFEHLVISATGRMTLMRTVAPSTFIEFKRWMAAHAEQREAAKRRRDERQADIVQSLLDSGLLTPTARLPKE
jgi:Nucleotidyltransferase